MAVVLPDLELSIVQRTLDSISKSIAFRVAYVNDIRLIQPLTLIINMDSDSNEIGRSLIG